MKLNRKMILKLIYKYLVLCIGLLLYSLAFNLFMLPNGFVTIGVSGLAIIINKLFAIDTSLFVLIFSVILTIMGFILCDKEKMYSSVASTFLLPFFIKITSNISSYFSINTSVLVSCIYCSILTGFALGIIYKVGLSTGGTEIIYWIMERYIKKSTGNLMIIVEGTIVLTGAFAFGFQKFMYSLIVLFLISNVSDRVVIGISDSKLILIMTEKNKAIKDYLNSILHVRYFSLKVKNEKEVIYCIVQTKDYKEIYDNIKAIDKNCFLSVTNTYEIKGGQNEKEKNIKECV